ncbi:MAG: alpha/beta hydrolase-fold protein [Acidobacteriota bacterium]
MRNHRLMTGTLLLLLSSPLLAFARAPETGFLDRAVTVGGVVYRYQVYVPNEWARNSKWPVILFLHGAGERGDDGLVQTEVGIGTAVRRYSARFPAIVVMPQCRKTRWWTENDMQAQALAALAQSITEFNGDKERIYLTGISMGGYGSWKMAAENPGKFAAVAPVCGGIRPPALPSVPQPPAGDTADAYGETAKKLGATPVWIFHGGDDKVVPRDESRKMNEALKAAGGTVKYTEYEGVGHNSWDRAYADAELMTWMLGQRLIGKDTPHR